MCKTKLSLAASTLAIATLLGGQAAYAAGVNAGTLIQNTASATYTSGAASATVQSNTVTVRVDELLDVAVATLDSAPQLAGPSSATLRYSVTNTGNGDEAFKITVDPGVAGNPYNTTIQTIAIDVNGNGQYDPGTDTVITNGGTTPQVAPDGVVKIVVVVTLPASAPDTVISQVKLTADAATGTGTPGTVFAGQGQGGGDAVVGATTASGNALDAVKASLASVTLTKSYTIADPFGGTQPVPGAVVTFSIKADVSGTGSVDNLHVTDVIPAGTTYSTGTLKLDGGALTDLSDTDAGTASASGVDVSLGTVTGGSSHTVSFSAKIN